MTTPDLAHRFRHHPPADDATKAAHAGVRRALSQTAHFIDATVPDGREKATALTKIEEALMWANAGIARSGPAKDPAATGIVAYDYLPPHTEGKATLIAQHEEAAREPWPGAVTIYVRARRRRTTATRPGVLNVCYGDPLSATIARSAVLVDPPQTDDDHDWINTSLRTRLAPGARLLDHTGKEVT